MRRISTILITLLIALSTMTIARADASWSHTFNFLESSEEFIVSTSSEAGFWEPGSHGQWISGLGWVPIPVQRAAPYSEWVRTLQTARTFAETVTVTDAEVVYDLSMGTDCSNGLGCITVSATIGGVTKSCVHALSGGTCVNGNNQSFVWPHGSYSVNSISLIETVSWPDPGIPNPPGSGAIRSITLSGEGDTDPFSEGGDRPTGPFKPISAPDIFNISDNHRQVTTRQNANAHSIGDGVVYDVNSSLGTFAVVVQPPGATSADDFIYYQNLKTVNASKGDHIEAGCVLGLVRDDTSGTQPFPVGNFTFNAPDSDILSWPEWSDAPGNTPCDANKYETLSCLNINPNFADDSKNWNADGHVENAPGGGMTIYSNASIYQDVQLDSESTYIVTLYATTVLGARSADLRVTFGQQDVTLHLNVLVANQSIKLASQTLSPGAADYAPDKYRLRITNVAPAGHLATPVLIRFACISTDAPAIAPGACYFDDSEMQSDTWSHDEGVTYESPTGGFSATVGQNKGTYTLPVTTAIWHDVDFSAFADHDTKFTLTVNSTNGDGTPAVTPPFGRFHAFVRDPITLDLIQDIGTWDTIFFIPTETSIEFTLTAGEHVAGDLVILNLTDYIDEMGWDLKVHSACLAVEGGVWPSFINSDASSRFAPECTICTQPGSISEVSTENLLGWVVSWLQYGWCYLGYILRCLLLQLLNSVWQTILSILTGVGLFGVWLGQTILVFAAWLADGARFGFNNLQAWAIPIINQVIAWLFSLPFIQWIIDKASLAGVWLDALFDIVIAVFNLFGTGVHLLAVLLNVPISAWSAFSDAVTGTSSVSFPFPDCNDSGSFLYDTCLILDIMNFVFDQVPALGVLVIAASLATGWNSVRRTEAKAREILAS